MSATYDQHRQRLVAAGIPAAVVASFGASVLYTLATLAQTDAWERVLTPALLVQLTTPLAAWALLRTRLRDNAELIAIAGDLLFTGALTVRLVGADASVSSVALFLSLKMLATALFLPWSARTQYVSAIATVIMYWVCLALGGRSIEADGRGLHQVLGPLIAAALSAAGCYQAERTRRFLYDREKDLAREAQVTTALAQIASELLSSVDKSVLMERLCQITVETLQCDASHLCLYDLGSDAFLVAASAGYPPEQREALRTLKIARGPFSAAMDYLAKNTVAQIKLSTLPDEGWRRLASEMGLGVSLAMVLARGDELIGLHSATFRGSHGPFTQAQERIARGMARVATLALENADLVKEIARSSQVKSDFVAAISHEVRSPLSVILGYTELLLADGGADTLSPQQRESIERIDKSGRELHELLTATLDLSRVAAGTLELDLGTVVLENLISQVDSETRELREKPGLRFGWRIADDLPELISDPLKLKVILKNLIGNAVKFTDEGSVIVEVRRRNDGVEFAVVDTGIGISTEGQARIFEAFRQETGRSKLYGGVGLGLYIAQRLTTLLGGTIGVESTPGQGSTFRVWIPAARHTATARGDAAPDAA
jgi:signal transduction histidine kinase